MNRPRSNRPPRHRGMILLFGSKRIMSNDTGEAIAVKCPRCGTEDSLKGIKVRSWFTIFFLPIFPLSRGQRYTQCSSCGASFATPPEQFATAAARADARQMQRAIAMYNSLRASPANSITLNELMQLYASMAEYNQAISAANDFPQALNHSEQCMVTLGRIYLSKNDPVPAMEWFEAALARNNDLGDAWYYKALAHLQSDPPDPLKAATAARNARKFEYPGAEELVKKAEESLQNPLDH